MLVLPAAWATLCLAAAGVQGGGAAGVPGGDAPAPAPGSTSPGQQAPELQPLSRGTLGPSVPLESSRLGYAVQLRVYEPAPALAGAGPLPVVYVTDGSDYWKPELGNVVPTLDELIGSGRMSPVIAVFIDAWDPIARRNRRYEQFLPAGTETREPFEACPFCDFIAEEVVPWVEARHAVDPERRGIVGSSLGGFNAAYMALVHPELFHFVGIQSPSIFRQPWFAPRVAHAPAQPRKVAMEVGVDEPGFLPGARALRDAYAERGVVMQYREVRANHSWAHWRATIGEVFRFLYATR